MFEYTSWLNSFNKEWHSSALAIQSTEEQKASEYRQKKGLKDVGLNIMELE